jgi:hypothetical protein
MKRLLLLTLIFAIPAFCQDATGISDAIYRAIAPLTPLVTLTSVDGTVCQLVKLASPTIYASYQCQSADKKTSVNWAPVKSASAAASFLTFGLGPNTLCVVALNPTASAVTMGSLGSVPASGISWSCAKDQSTIVAGTAVWP